MNADEHSSIARTAVMEKLKSGLRSQIRAMLKNVPPEKCKLDSAKLCVKLKEQPFFHEAGSILFYAPLPGEPDLWPLLEETVITEKIIAKPRFDSAGKNYVACRVKDLQNEIAIGRFGVREPNSNCRAIPLNDLDLILVPGIAFDRNGHRLGRGKGYYDRLLEMFNGKKCGIAFDEQIVEEIPVGSHDVKMDFILTPTRCVKVVK